MHHGSECAATTGNKLLIKGGVVVNADRQQEADVYVENGIIIRVEPNLEVDHLLLGLCAGIP